MYLRLNNTGAHETRRSPRKVPTSRDRALKKLQPLEKTGAKEPGTMRNAEFWDFSGAPGRETSVPEMLIHEKKKGLLSLSDS